METLFGLFMGILFVGVVLFFALAKSEEEMKMIESDNNSKSVKH